MLKTFIVIWALTPVTIMAVIAVVRSAIGNVNRQ
jgi:hypothetical protein